MNFKIEHVRVISNVALACPFLDLTNAGKKRVRRSIKKASPERIDHFFCFHHPPSNSLDPAASFRAETKTLSVSKPQTFFPPSYERAPLPHFHFIIIKAATMTRSPLVHELSSLGVSGVILLMHRLKSGAKRERTSERAESGRERAKQRSQEKFQRTATDIFLKRSGEEEKETS